MSTPNLKAAKQLIDQAFSEASRGGAKPTFVLQDQVRADACDVLRRFRVREIQRQLRARRAA